MGEGVLHPARMLEFYFVFYFNAPITCDIHQLHLTIADQYIVKYFKKSLYMVIFGEICKRAWSRIKRETSWLLGNFLI